MKRFPSIGLLLGLLLPLITSAAEVKGIYEAEVPVADQQEEARTATGTSAS